MLLDYHMHTHLCKHAVGMPGEYVQQAKKMGLAEIGFSDHMPMPPVYDPENRMEASQFPEYLRLIEEAREESDGFPIRLGIEGDYVAGHVDYVREFLKSTDFDYVYGSVHFIGDWGFDNPEHIEEYKNRSIADVYEEYFSLIIEAAETRLFDIISHFDLVKKFGHRPENGYLEMAGNALTAVKDNDLAIEINTAGFRRPAQEAFPGIEILRIARSLEVPITLGSDSHAPADVGRDFDRVIPWLKEVGYSTIHQYINRERIAVPIED